MANKEMNLHQKILKIADMAGVLQKTKEGYGYKYVPEEDIQAKVTAGLQKYGVMLYDSIIPGTYAENRRHSILWIENYPDAVGGCYQGEKDNIEKSDF